MQKVKLLERIERLAEAICRNCSGTGSVAEHSPRCNGDCRDCPQQARCDECWSTGIAPYKIEPIELTTLRDQVRELVEELEKGIKLSRAYTNSQVNSDDRSYHQGQLGCLNRILELITDSKGGE